MQLSQVVRLGTVLLLLVNGPCTAAFVCITGMHWAMLQAFDGSTGLPRRCVEMSSWPRMDRLGGSFWLHLKRALVESFFPTSTSEGVSVMFDR